MTWRLALWAAGTGVTLAAAGFLIAWLGLVPIAASSGHWAITDWFLHFAMRQSVQTRAIGIKTPQITSPALVTRGAGHFQSGCEPCHGAPGVKPSTVSDKMSPPPPDLAPLIGQWRPRELFWIVKHGVKYTGMPAWVAQQREDEVWAMVAFLLRLPRLTPHDYRILAHGEDAADPTHQALQAVEDPMTPALAVCARCHGRDGAGRGQGAFPRLAGQREDYLFAALQAYAEGYRYSGIMQPVAASLDRSTIGELARHYASRGNVPAQAAVEADRAAVRRGEDIARRGAPEQGVPSCIHCHGPSETPRNPYYPVLAGQYPDYLVLQLELFQKGTRGGSPFSPVMSAAAHRLKPRQILDVSLYYATLRPDSGAGAARRD